jgi:hypothetical protein
MKIILFVSVDEYGKLQGNAAFKKTIFKHLVLEKKQQSI